MYILYLDESGSVGSINEQHFVLGGVAVFERRIHWISKELNRRAAADPRGSASSGRRRS